MEVLSFFSKDKEFVHKLDNFLLSYPSLELDSEFSDTKYFLNIKTKRNEIYFHFLFNNVGHEFVRDYTEEEQKYIKGFFDNEKFYFFDIQFRNEKFIQQLLQDFKGYLNRYNGYQENSVLINHPHKGIMLL
ncbi:hypothetical protein [Emticicia sp. TH156]|uniref:hypothetical protein n=1 Tax=Emticicia sp. TH156 TaxID=2067454 RepID=UPI000C758058|nr:hypothetical protein [Emticicia sp. TH156]PLK43914.1 hypothetical protein C0V77_12230 [Emticicia sp. TH156]